MITLGASSLLTVDMAGLMKASYLEQAYGTVAIQALFMVVFAWLIYGNLLYQLCRSGYLLRLKKHRRASHQELDRIVLSNKAPRVTCLIPSYKEELSVIRQSVLSCALQDYPNRRVVLLIDNPPDSKDAEDIRSLEATRRLVTDLQELLDTQKTRFEENYENFQKRMAEGTPSLENEKTELRRAQLHAARWFTERFREEPAGNHTDFLFAEMTYRVRAKDEYGRIERVSSEINDLTQNQAYHRIAQEYVRLCRMFDVTLSSFERKLYVNLSHEANKAMNLNSYLALMGKHFQETELFGKKALVACPPSKDALFFEDSEFVLTLDADSILDPEYTVRLVDQIEKPGNERVSVIQTPYTAIPEAPGTLERVAGATTDLQYIIHQGFTRWNATFWVGANALIRRQALEDIAVEDEERGFHVKRYIQDRTVIEDTESSVDMVDLGWRLYNYPERLSYSATPADFGSLLIQRRRWANGGLIILPKLLRLIAKRGLRLRTWAEAFFRVHYLSSIAAVNFGLVLILAYPFERPLNIRWLPLTAVPYYALYARDLMMAGYRFGDLFRVYALNLLLVPINIGGVLKSIWQMATRCKIPFSRTPKVSGLTLAPEKYTAFELFMCAYCLLGASVDAWHHRWMYAGCALANALILCYAFRAFFDFKANISALSRALYRPKKQKTASSAHSPLAGAVLSSGPIR